MKKLILIFLLISSVVYAQFNPPQNLEVEQEYIFPSNYYYLSWELPEPGDPDLINYNIYVNWNVFATVPANVLTYSMVDPPDTLGHVYFYITALYENPIGESPPSNIVVCEPALSLEDNIISYDSNLLDNYPNPFNSKTNISFSLKKDSYVTLSIYNVKGKVVKTILNEQKVAGEYNIIWDGKDNFGTPVSQGIYFCNIRIGEYTSSRKMLLAK